MSAFPGIAVAALAAASLFSVAAGGAPAEYFGIRVVDEDTGRGVPLVELRTVNDIGFVTDSRGLIAFLEPGLMDREVFFHVFSHGYTFPKDGFGITGVRLQTTPGTEATVRVKRINVAERLYRVTGGGIYRDTVLLGGTPPLKAPVLNGDVLGQDSVLTAVYRNRIYWFWGDTNRPSYPLGNFHTPGAVSELPGKGGLDPGIGVDLTYFLDDRGFAAPTCRMPGDGPTWIGGLAVVPDADGRERLVTGYAKIRNMLETYERGVAVFNDEAHAFEKVNSFGPDVPLHPDGHAFVAEDGGERYVYFATAFPLMRVRASLADYLDPARYQGFTCLKAGVDPEHPEADRDERGRLRFSWRTGASPVDGRQQEELVKKGVLRPEEAPVRLWDIETGGAIAPHNGGVNYNAYRKRYVMVVSQSMGKPSFLGETWYAEADSPTGPWIYARRIVTHDTYSFYNPRHHPMLDADGGRVIHFEGTYTRTFSGNAVSTPRYDYNQIMYRLDLSDERLHLPVPVYAYGTGGLGTFGNLPPGTPAGDVPFLARDRAGAGTVPVYTDPGGRIRTDGTGGGEPAFYGLPLDADAPGTVILHVSVGPDGGNIARTGPPETAPDARPGRPLCRVWANPRLP